MPAMRDVCVWMAKDGKERGKRERGVNNMIDLERGKRILVRFAIC